MHRKSSELLHARKKQLIRLVDFLPLNVIQQAEIFSGVKAIYEPHELAPLLRFDEPVTLGYIERPPVMAFLDPRNRMKKNGWLLPTEYVGRINSIAQLLDPDLVYVKSERGKTLLSPENLMDLRQHSNLVENHTVDTWLAALAIYGVQRYLVESYPAHYKVTPFGDDYVDELVLSAQPAAITVRGNVIRSTVHVTLAKFRQQLMGELTTLFAEIDRFIGEDLWNMYEFSLHGCNIIATQMGDYHAWLWLCEQERRKHEQETPMWFKE